MLLLTVFYIFVSILLFSIFYFFSFRQKFEEFDQLRATPRLIQTDQMQFLEYNEYDFEFEPIFFPKHNYDQNS